MEIVSIGAFLDVVGTSGEKGASKLAVRPLGVFRSLWLVPLLLHL